jgi:hypothetical protein
MIREINIIELASELAHQRTKIELGIIDSAEMYEQQDREIRYKYSVQDVFDAWYDYYLDRIDEL